MFLFCLLAGAGSGAIIIAFITGILILALLPVIYSYRLYSKINKGNKTV
jgi:hypothetical protein